MAKRANTALQVIGIVAINFFVFEFVHCLIDISRGQTQIRSPLKFSLFALFLPSMVAGPISAMSNHPQFMAATSRRILRLTISKPSRRQERRHSAS